MTILLQLQHLHATILTVPSGMNLRRARDELAFLAEEIKGTSALGQLSESEQSAALSYIINIRAIAKAAVDIERIRAGTMLKTTQSVSNELQSRGHTLVHKAPLSQTAVSANSGPLLHRNELASNELSTRYEPCRLWFLSHLPHPYPDAAQRTTLLAELPHLNAQKLQTWFTNTRRRSGWSALYKKYANSKRDQMELLISRCDDPLQRDSVDPCAREALEGVRAYFRESEKRKQVAEWMDEVLEKHRNGGNDASVVVKQEQASSPSVPSTPTRSFSSSSVASTSSSASSATSVDLQSSPETSPCPMPTLLHTTSPSSPTITTKRKRTADEDLPEPPSSPSPTHARRIKKAKPSLYTIPNLPSAPFDSSADVPVFPSDSGM